MDKTQKDEIRRQCTENGIFMEGDWQLTGYIGYEEPVNIGHFSNMDTSTIGAFTYLRQRASLWNADIGRYCSIAFSTAIGVSQHPIDGLSSAPLFYHDTHFSFFDDYKPNQTWEYKQRAVVGNDVWVGRDALIMPGVRVHDGAVIGARSIVTRDVEPYSVVVGIPAKPIKKRFSDAIIQRLMTLSWWNYDIRSWSKQNPEFRSIPLTEETLAQLEDAVARQDLKRLTPKRHLLMTTKDGVTFSDF